MKSGLVIAVVLTIFAVVMLYGARSATPASAACTPVQVVPIVLQQSGYTDDEAARRLNAATGYAVRKVRYARAVYGLVNGRYITTN